MTADRPIFVVGPHRSGTTLLYRLIAGHPDVAFLTALNKRWPASPRIANLLSRLLQEPRPMEAQPFWDRFKKSDEDLVGAEAATTPVKAWYQRMVGRVQKIRGCSRFVAKYPRLSMRLGWVDAIFPDACFIHVTRDWRAVVNSTTSRKQRREKREGGWFGVYVPGWQELEDLPHEEASASIYRIVTEHLEAEAANYPGRFASIAYEDLCADPRTVMQQLADFCGLARNPEWIANLPEKYESANFKWRDNLDAAQLDRIRQQHPEFFARHERS
jgi:hypothetical protein